MMGPLVNVLLGAALLCPALADITPRVQCGEVDGDIYQFSAKTLENGTDVSFQEYRGKVVLVVNVATYCGGTIPTYTQMNALAEFYVDEDFEILGFPCNQFLKLEPGTNSEILNGIQYVRPGDGFEPLMTLFQKTEVNGATEDPLFTFLKSACASTFTEFYSGLFYEPITIGDIQWNFEKFLIGKDGKPFSRYHPSVQDPEALKDDINTLLNA
ncbi:glutathione peroxidase-like [Procambarus clarkii]|uniref:glutathione peroxidase-like n=1 Tax=Procambarus clarkii TaxID=6728 RepID=UPI001E6739E5|nr:glutathione peroxidase-like [Procambarus clarkii]